MNKFLNAKYELIAITSHIIMFNVQSAQLSDTLHIVILFLIFVRLIKISHKFLINLNMSEGNGSNYAISNDEVHFDHELLIRSAIGCNTVGFSGICMIL